LLTGGVVADGDTLTVNGDSTLTLLIGAFDLGTVSSLTVTPDPAAPTGSTVGVETTATGVAAVTATITVTPDTPTYGAAAAQGVKIPATAVDDDALTATLAGINVAINEPAIFRDVFDATVGSSTATLASTDVGLTAAGADVREVTVTEGEILTILLEAKDMSAPDAITLEATGTAISSAATIKAATLAGTSVLDSETVPTASIAGAGTAKLEFEPGFEAIPFGADVQKVTFTLRATVADSLQKTKDVVDIVINVVPKPEAPVVVVTDVTVVNADGLTSASLGAVASANVQETSSVVVTAQATDPGGEPVTLAFSTDSTLSGDSDLGTPTAGAATVGSMTVAIGLSDADVAASGLDTDTDPTVVTVTGTNDSGLSGSAAVTLDLLNLSQPPQIVVTATVDGVAAEIVDGALSARPGEEVVLAITATDTDGELVIMTVTGITGELKTQPPEQGLLVGTYTFTVPTDLTADTAETLSIKATDGGFLSATTALTVNMLVGNHAPVVALDPAATTVTEGESVVIGLSVTDVDGDTVSITSDVGTVGTVTKVGDVSTADLTVVGTTAGDVITITVTATDGAGAAGTGTATVTVEAAPVTPTPVAEAGTVVVSQGYGATGSNIRIDPTAITMVPKSAFPGMPSTFAALINTSRARSANTAVADIDGDGVKDIVVGFGPGGLGSDFPSVVVAWTTTGGGDEGDRPTVITAKNVFASGAGVAAYQNVHGALNLAAGNFVAGETLPMVVAAQGLGGSNQIRLLQYAEDGDRKMLNIVATFQGLTGAAAQLNGSGGTSVAAGDVDGDGLDELVVGQMNGTGATTFFQILDLQKVDSVISVLRRTAPVFAMPNAAFRGLGGVNLAVGDVDGDGDNDIVTSCAGLPDGANNEALKNFIRVFSVTTDDQNRVAQLGALTPVIQVLGAAVNPSGGLDVACGNLDDDAADEVVISSQAIMTLDATTGEVTASSLPFEGKNFLKAWNLAFDADGTYTGLSAVFPLIRAFGGEFAPSSGALNVEIYPAN
jgi:hypothetical protein